jgi:hypothetical protein
MTLCPIALVAGCRKCPAFSVCPLKRFIGDYRKEQETHTSQKADSGEAKAAVQKAVDKANGVT